MGFFKSVRELRSVADDMLRDQPSVADRTAHAMAAMQSSQAMMASLTEATTVEAELRAGGAGATATVTTVGSGQGMVGMSPILTIELVVQPEGRAPAPATVQAAVPQHLLHRITPGAQVPVLVEVRGARVALDTVALATA